MSLSLFKIWSSLRWGWAIILFLWVDHDLHQNWIPESTIQASGDPSHWIVFSKK